MPFAPKIRKDILQALETKIIPALQSQEVLLLLAAPPFDFSAVKHWTIRKELLPDNDKGPLQILREWSEYKLVAKQGFGFSFLYEGRIHAKVGALESHGNLMQRQKLKPPPGIQIVELVAPACTLRADFTAHENGELYKESMNDFSRTMSLMFSRNEIAIFHSSRDAGQHASSHHLQIDDETISQLGEMYLEQLRLNSNQAFAQTLLLALMYRLQYYLESKKPGISNSCWIDPKNELVKPRSPLETKHHALCADVIDYVQNHVHHPLSLKMIAEQFGISPFHLNTIFQQVYGSTVMRYVTDLRVNVAKHILVQTTERINAVAHLTGFASAASFSHVFRKKTGMSPREYRWKGNLDD